MIRTLFDFMQKLVKLRPNDRLALDLQAPIAIGRWEGGEFVSEPIALIQRNGKFLLVGKSQTHGLADEFEEVEDGDLRPTTLRH